GARRRVAPGLRHRRQRRDLRRAPLRLRRGRPALRPRPLAPLPDGAARPPRRVRAGGGRLREADALERDRVPAQGADVRALLADRAARQDAARAAARLPARPPLTPPPPLRLGAAPPRPARELGRARRERLGLRRRARRPGPPARGGGG